MGVLKIWHIRKDISIVIYELNESPNELIILLPKSVKIPDFKSERRKKEWLSARFLAFTMFNSAELFYNNLKKPYLKDKKNIKISISHSGSLLTFAYSSTFYIGVDFQVFTAKTLKILHKFTSHLERKLIDNSIKKATLVWAAKEALYKLAHTKVADYANDLQVVSIAENSLEAKIFDEKIILDYLELENGYICFASSLALV